MSTLSEEDLIEALVEQRRSEAPGFYKCSRYRIATDDFEFCAWKESDAYHHLRMQMRGFVKSLKAVVGRL